MHRHCIWVAGLLCCAACTGKLESRLDREAQNPPHMPSTNNTPHIPDMSTSPDMPGMPGDPVLPTTTFACDANAQPPELPLRRLSAEQYRNTVRDIINRYAAPGRAQATTTEAMNLARALPEDARKGQPNDTHGGYRRLDQVVHQEHVNVTLDVAVAIGKAFTQDGAALTQLMGACATDTNAGNDDTCVTNFLNDFGQRALRRPLSPEDQTFYRRVYDANGISAAGARDVVAVMLTAPHFLYHVEHGGAPINEATQTYELDAFELASRLSYHFWQTGPDDALLNAAQDGSLLTEDGYRAQVERVFEDPRTSASLHTFFREWLWLDELPPLDALNGTPIFDAFTGANQPSATLRDQMVSEIEEMATYHTLTQPSSFGELLTSNLSFAREQELASIYGVAPWDGSSEPPSFPEGERAGLITRAALLSTGTANTRPIIKGFFLRKALLCTTPPPPPDNAAMFKVELSEDFTTREIVEELTEQDGSACAGCHKTFINGLGFPTEGFDALGRVRTQQRLFNEEGQVVNQRDVHTVSTPRIWPQDLRKAQGAKELGDMLDASKEVHACFVRHYWRFTFGRPEDRALDGCGLEQLRERVVAGAPLRDVMMEIAMRPEFRRRSFRSEM